MKLTLISLVTCATVVLVCAQTPVTNRPSSGVRLQSIVKRGSGPATNSPLGTWQLASFKYGTNEQSFAEVPASQRRIKLITDTHFTWVEFDATARKAQGVAGGAYSLSGDTYTESIDWVDAGMEPYLGKKHAFTIRVEGDKFFLSGALADGLKIEENWQRVK